MTTTLPEKWDLADKAPEGFDIEAALARGEALDCTGRGEGRDRAGGKACRGRGGEAPALQVRPTILVEGGSIASTIDAAEAALLAAKPPDFRARPAIGFSNHEAHSGGRTT